jgi:hypothetical protein
MNEINEKRFYRRVLAVCRLLDLDGKFLGFTLDLTLQGIMIIVPNTYPDEEEFSVMLQQIRDDNEVRPNIIIKLEKAWRKPSNEEYDLVGGKIISAQPSEELESLIKYSDEKAKEKYDFALGANF